jgi:hypothetical protein
MEQAQEARALEQAEEWVEAALLAEVKAAVAGAREVDLRQDLEVIASAPTVVKECLIKWEFPAMRRAALNAGPP